MADDTSPSDLGRIEQHVRSVIDAAVARGVTPAEVVIALLGATSYALVRAGHKDVDNLKAFLGDTIARMVSREARP